MKLAKYFLAVLYCGSAFAFWSRPDQDGPKIRLALHSHDAGYATFTPGEMLEPKSRKSGLYELALTDLMKLGKESTCHQITTKLYMSSCQLFQELEVHSHGSLVTRGGGRLQDYIDSFAISRAICDLETAHAVIPEACGLFREPALLRVMNSKDTQGLDISHEQIGQCMKALHSDQKSWTSYNSNKESATLLCRASRLDIDKDDFISTMQTVVTILRDVEVADAQRKAKREADQAEADLAAKKHFQNVREQVSDLKDRFLSIWNQVSEESIGVANSLMNALKKASGDVESTNLAMNRILTSLMEGNAEHALAQENAAMATSGLALVAQSATLAIVDIRRLIEGLGFNVTTMGIALMAVEQRHAEAIDEQDTQVRELLKDVREELQNVKKITSEVKADAERTALWFSNLALDMLPAGPWGISWPLLVLAPLVTVVLVGYGIPASYTRNISLIVVGILVAKILTLVINAEWETDAMKPSSLTQLARERLLTSIVTTPVDIELADSVIILDSPLDILAEIK